MSRKPLDQDLYDSVVAEAKRKFDVWPSAYASGWVVKTYKARGGRYGGESKGSRTGLTKWFGESWVDLSRPIREDGEVVGYEPCGRKKSDDPADYPKCRPAREAMRMTPSEVRDAVKRKRAAEAKAAKGRGGRGARAPVRVATYKQNPDGSATIDVTQTEAFRRWFGDSKVVDENGEPLVVWHGHPRNVDAFPIFDFSRAIDLGMHFGTQASAFEAIGTRSSYAMLPGSPLHAYVRPFYLSLQNPLGMSDPGDWISSGFGSFKVPTLEQLFGKGIITAREYEEAYDKVRAIREGTTRITEVTDRRVAISKVVRAVIFDAGYDGIYYTNETEDVGSRSWIAFFPEQIKLADGTNMTFDPENPDVRQNPDVLSVTGVPTYTPTVGEEPWELPLEALDRFFEEDPSSSRTRIAPPNTRPLPPVGVWRADPILRYVEQLQELPIDAVSFTEDINDPSIRASVQAYIEYYEQGLEPVPASVVWNEPAQRLVTTNRRRVLAAKLAGRDTFLAWVGGDKHEDVVDRAFAAGLL